MISMNERQRLIKILELLNEEETIQKKVDISNRLRDEQGRFRPNQSESKTKEELPLRSIKVVKVKGTYGTYLIKERWLTEEAIGVILTIGIVTLLAVIF